MIRLLSAFLLCCALSTAAVAQQAQPAPTPTQPVYGLAMVDGPNLGNRYFLILNDGVTPNPKQSYYQENGKDRVFADEAAILNFLYSQGWEVIPNPSSVPGPSRYLLKRRGR
ncbi:hypothetical protein LJY25_16005 [Hymenobacter sp. BT175]|uniref:hypothetical protein n=1 Tax=Hymenobacter translucens TaxID=2886507 RepID=UPI001D0F2565|nr:hypothetical protein [Hymenobacter translucens]MCC2547953.1 hypothetical protein [Hymenobacter translucens]